MTEHYDVIIIGTGAGGGTLAHTLAASGKRILLLERGDFLPREMDNWDPEAGVRGREVHLQGHLVRRRRQAVPAAGPLLRGRGDQAVRRGPVPAAARRTSARSSTSTGSPRPGRCPTTTSSRGTRRAEQLYQVHGNGGEDPTEGHRSEPYPWPAVSHEPRIQQISDGLAKGGYHPFHAPCGILLNEADRPRSTCIRCTWCDGYPCLVHAKSDAEVIAVRPVLGRDNVTLLTGAEVTRLETDASGRTVTGVVVSRDGEREVYTGDIVAVSRRRRQQRQDPAQLGQ